MYDMATDSEIQASIDEEISKQISVLHRLRTRRNAYSPISRLPTETLADIFIHCARDHHYEDRWHFTLTVPSWVNVSYVCHRWRNVALNCATLWTYVFIASRRWTEALLARSKQALLKLHVSARGQDIPPGLHLVERVMNHAERIQELHLLFQSTATQQVFSILSSRAPYLQNLKIWTTFNSPEWPLVLFHGDTPALRTLELIRCPLPWYSFRLSGLTTLSLQDVPVRFQKNTVELLATLSCMQDLKHLYLHDALASAADFLVSEAFHTFQKINMPHLSRLLIVGPVSTTVALLSCIDFPSTTEIRLDCSPEDGPFLRPYALLFPTLKKVFSVPDDQAMPSHKICSLIIESSALGKAKLTFSGSERDCKSFRFISHEEWGCNIPLKIVIDPTLFDDGDIIGEICCSIPSTNIQSLYFSGYPFIFDFWWRMMDYLQGLRYIVLSDCDIPHLAPILSLDTMNEDGQDTGNEYDFLPMLEEIELHHIEFPSKGDPDTKTTLRHLLDALYTRDVPQGRLTIVESIIGLESEYFDMVWSWEGHVVSGSYPSSWDGPSYGQ